MRICLIIATLGTGGSERAMQQMADHWANQGHAVSLVTFARAEDDFYPVHPHVRRLGLNLMTRSSHLLAGMRNNLVRIAALRRILPEICPDIVISFGDTTNVQTLVAAFGHSIPVVVCEQVDPRRYAIGAVWNVMRRAIYPTASRVVVVSQAMADGWAHRIVSKAKVSVIPNPVYVTPDDGERRSFSKGSYTIAAMGRLVRQKGFDRLLRAFRLCCETYPDWSVAILGEGEERRALEELSRELHLDGRVKFLGIVREPARVLKQSDLFVMSSRFEGFPLALIEAMACGLPVISTDCPTGPSEIIRHGIDGVLVPDGDVLALASAMDRLMTSPAERARFGERAVEIVQRFGPDRIMQRWDAVLSSVVPRPAHEPVAFSAPM